MMLKLEIVPKSKEAILHSLMQKYLYEMSLYYDNTMDECGSFAYKYLPFYFMDEDRQAYFIYDDETRIGFALINTHSFTGEKIDSCIAEFTIFPAYRKRGYAMQAIDALMQTRPGSWQLKYSKRNLPGAAFWRKVAEKYRGTETPLEDGEIALTIR